jgi:hypothetical protein
MGAGLDRIEFRTRISRLKVNTHSVHKVILKGLGVPLKGTKQGEIPDDKQDMLLGLSQEELIELAYKASQLGWPETVAEKVAATLKFMAEAVEAKDEEDSEANEVLSYSNHKTLRMSNVLETLGFLRK